MNNFSGPHKTLSFKLLKHLMCHISTEQLFLILVVFFLLVFYSYGRDLKVWIILVISLVIGSPNPIISFNSLINLLILLIFVSFDLNILNVLYSVHKVGSSFLIFFRGTAFI
ncbi:hypothetical protein BpHYR1_001440 [Brachionus plicatilis]|uniref:Uncharacterized protein n=1 Tax=Brachionus plicatilis TaxID=10195 RepID=A0A3M7PUI1_BRAPC|nr:hypothetical protein BpHYR1_001440 [Brachionus plicatilis]